MRSHARRATALRARRPGTRRALAGMKRTITTHITAGLLLALAGAPAAVAIARESGVQISPDGRQALVSKDVGAERWVIVRSGDGTVSGNVFRGEDAPLFVWCEPREDAPGSDDTVALSCFGADACAAAPCDDTGWNFVGDVDLPASFFAPPSPSDTPTPDDSPSPSRTPTPTTTSPPATPTPSIRPSPSGTPTGSTTPGSTSTPVGTMSPGPDQDIRCCVPDDRGPECEDRTPAECAARGGVNLGAGSCTPNPCS